MFRRRLIYKMLKKSSAEITEQHIQNNFVALIECSGAYHVPGPNDDIQSFAESKNLKVEDCIKLGDHNAYIGDNCDMTNENMKTVVQIAIDCLKSGLMSDLNSNHIIYFTNLEVFNFDELSEEESIETIIFEDESEENAFFNPEEVSFEEFSDSEEYSSEDEGFSFEMSYGEIISEFCPELSEEFFSLTSKNLEGLSEEDAIRNNFDNADDIGKDICFDRDSMGIPRVSTATILPDGKIRVLTENEMHDQYFDNMIKNDFVPADVVNMKKKSLFIHNISQISFQSPEADKEFLLNKYLEVIINCAKNFKMLDDPDEKIEILEFDQNGGRLTSYYSLADLFKRYGMYISEDGSRTENLEDAYFDALLG